VLFVQVGQRHHPRGAGFRSLAPVAPRLPPIRDVFRMGNGLITVGFFDRFFQGDGVEPLRLADDFERSVAGDAKQPGAEAGIAAKPFRFSSALKKVCCVTSSRLVRGATSAAPGNTPSARNGRLRLQRRPTHPLWREQPVPGRCSPGLSGSSYG